jgi:hypothetical protein
LAGQCFQQAAVRGPGACFTKLDCHVGYIFTKLLFVVFLRPCL